MKQKLKKYIAILMIFAMTFSMGITSVVASGPLTYSATSNVEPVEDASPNQKTETSYIWTSWNNQTNENELFVAIVVSQKPVEVIRYNGNPVTPVSIMKAESKTEVLTINGTQYAISADNSDKHAHWEVFNLGALSVTSPFSLSIDTGPEGFSTDFSNVIIKCNVTFDVDYEFTPKTSTVTVTAGSTLGDGMPTPSRPNYTFGGWFSGKDGSGTQLMSTTPINENKLVYAKWTAVQPRTYEVTFDVDYEFTPKTSTVTVTAGSALGDGMPTPSRPNYTFGGWFSGRDGSGTQLMSTTPIAENKLVYAKWTQNEQPPVNYTVTFNQNYGNQPATSTMSVPANTALGTDLPTLSRVGYRFDGWFANADGTGEQFTGNTVVTGNRTVYAKWTQNQQPVVCTVIFNLNYEGATTPYYTTSIMQNLHLGDSMPTNPARAGHNFAGWFLSTDGTGSAFEGSTAVTGNMTVYAKWTAIEIPVESHQLTINYKYTNGNTAAPSHTATVNKGAVYSVVSPTISGYTADKPTVAGTMGESNITVDVTYTVNPVNPPVVNQPIETTTPSIPGKPDLTITKTDNGTMVSPGALVEYYITVENKGNAPAAGVKVYETLPEGASFVGNSNLGWSLESGKYVYNLNTVNVGDKKEVKFVLQVNNDFPADKDKILNEVEVKDNGIETATTDNKASDDTPVLVVKVTIEEPKIVIPSTPAEVGTETPEPTQGGTIEEPAPETIPDLPFTGGVAAVELMAMGLGLTMAAAGTLLRKRK